MKKEQRIIFNRGKLQTTVALLQLLIKETESVAQLLRDDGVDVSINRHTDPDEKKDDADAGV